MSLDAYHAAAKMVMFHQFALSGCTKFDTAVEVADVIILDNIIYFC